MTTGQETRHGEAANRSVTVVVNNKPVTFTEHRATGLQIKQTAIAQGVAIELNFNLFEIKGEGKLKPVADDDVVTLNRNDEFRAVAPDDNS